ncbi:MAG TPA: ubiquitin-conjugating enzyme E2 [Tepidisphaeraceae bacterium]|jgi:ubiquitin-protein ligase/DNA-directed RNA polymerase subunit RPC12/RpoP|nr:ubiquitin-conjugating enzyme E2 [Tepidisphaeraceae bacterium]
MIRFACSGCGGEFNVPDGFAGRRAHCKKCGSTIVVPAAETAPAAPAPDTAPAKTPVRTRRLIADLRQIREAFGNGSLIKLLATEGEPTEVYKIEYHIRGIESLKSKRPVFREQHVAEIRMTHDYPRLAPACRMLTPIFHPNIDLSSICVGDHWVAGERLSDLVVRIGQMIAYQAYNIKSPLNGEAAMWADLNPDALPIDARDLYPPMLESTKGY